MPNTKTKKFDWQIFLAVFCILLVICCAIVCCVVSNTDKGVARAYEPVTNPDFYTNTKFYLKSMNNYTRDDVMSFVEYFAYGQEGIMDSTTSFSLKNVVGYIWFDFGSSTKTVYLELEITQVSDFGMLSIILYLTHPNGSSPNLFSFYYDYNNNAILDFSVAQNDGLANLSYEYDVTMLKDKTWATTSLFGSGFNYTNINMLEFNFNSTSDLGCILSSTTSFSIIPELGGGGDSDELQAEIDRLTGIIQEQRQEIQYYESLNLNQSQIPIFNIARCSPSTFEYNGVTYTSDTIERTSSGWDIYHSSYLNQELPENYGVGFSLFLVETLSNTKFDMSPLIQCWYNYTGATGRLLGFSVGYRTQNGQIVKVGEFSSDLPAENEFFINSPTNELVFFCEESNLMEVDDDFSIVRYQYDLESIYNDAYDDGIKMGMLLGRQEGYNQGVLDANDYSFFSLFTSVFDAPITAIVGKWGDSDGDGVYQREGGMLNFYIPGLDINFAPFLLSLFTIGLIVLIIRFILARKS